MSFAVLRGFQMYGFWNALRVAIGGMQGLPHRLLARAPELETCIQDLENRKR